MSNFLIPFGRGFLEVPYTNNLNVEVIDLPENQEQDETALIAAAFKKLNFEKIAGASSIGVVVSDLSRPIPNEKILKVFWTELKSFDISKNKLCFYIASGLHKPANQQEIELILGSYFSKEFKVVVHDARSSVLQRIGVTSRGTPVQINKKFVKAEVKIVIGSVQPHQIVGYSGGTKSVAIGLGGEEFITSNHSLLTHPACKMGNLNNPARNEIEEVAQMINLNILINVILDRKGKIAFINAGEPEASYKQAIDFASSFFSLSATGRKDIVIVSPGGYPKDLNLYQSQKALNSGARILKPDGQLILVASCEEGIGNKAFFQYLKRFTRPDELLTHFEKEPFRIGPHKAYLWAQSVKKHKVILVSKLKKHETRYLMVQSEDNLYSALSHVLNGSKGKVEIGIIPHASSVML